MEIIMNITMGDVILPSSGGVAKIQRIFDGVVLQQLTSLITFQI